MTTATTTLTQDPQSHDARVGERVLMLMFRARISQTALGKRVGMSQTALSHKIRGARKWTLDDLYAVAGALGVSVYDLLGNDESAPTPKSESATVGPAGLEPTTSTVVSRRFGRTPARDYDRLAPVTPLAMAR